uniref:Uncharacterized protein n=1 Tax=Anguilla anguilla TaxID=7936 RepID=A0A0E9WVJ2_ANGAN
MSTHSDVHIIICQRQVAAYQGKQFCSVKRELLFSSYIFHILDVLFTSKVLPSAMLLAHTMLKGTLGLCSLE